MPNEFNAHDIFEMAVMIEKNGAVFYREAAEQVEKSDQKELLLELARMENSHETTFAKMQKELQDQEMFTTTFDPENENVLYLKALADTKVFSGKNKPEKSIRSILSGAIQVEKDSIAFYTGMKELIPEKYGQAKINDIIKEEMSHIRLLAGKFAEYS